MTKQAIQNGIMLVLFIFYALLCSTGYAQNAYEVDFSKKYNENIQLESINGTYIPQDVEEAISELDRLSSPDGRAMLKSGKEEDIGKTLIFGLGKWMIVNWNFYEGSRLSHHLKQRGVTAPDDMAQYLIVTYYRHLNRLPLELDERARAIYEMRKKEQEERNKRKNKINP